MMSKYVHVSVLAGGLVASLGAGAMGHEQMQQQQQQGRRCFTVPTPLAAPSVTSCKLKDHVTTYEMGNGGKVVKHVVKTTECLLAKDWQGAKKHSDTMPIDKVGGNTTQQQQTAQQTCSPLAVTPMSLCVEQDVEGDSHAKLVKKDYYTYEFNREGGEVKVVNHDCSNETVTVEEFFDAFVDASNIKIDDAISALEDHLRTRDSLTIVQQADKMDKSKKVGHRVVRK